jgi:GxxExxY protein
MTEMDHEEYLRINKVSNIVIGAAIDVHKELGPGLLESVYEECLKLELESKGIKVETQKDLPLIYKGQNTGKTYRIDMLVDDRVIVELKSVESLKPVNEIQIVTYLRLSNLRVGLLINFNVPVLKEGIKRKVNNFYE